LFGPGSNGWLQACRAWVQEGRTEDPCVVYDCLERIVRGLDPFPEEVARLHLSVTRMAGCARRLLQAQEPVGSEERPELRQTLLDCACEALQPDGGQAAASWEEIDDLGESLAADSPLSLVRKALTLAADRVGLVASSQAPRTWHLRRIGWLCDLAEYLLSDATKTSRPSARQVRSALVLVPQRQQSDAYIAEFVFEAVEGEGTGEVFLAPQQAFVQFGEGFDTVFGETADVVADLLQQDRKALANVRVRVDALDSRTGRWDWHGMDQEVIEGPSATGAVVRGLHAAWSRPALVYDRAVVCLCAVDRHARVGAVNDLARKVQAVVTSGRFDTIVIDGGKESLRQIEAEAPGCRIERAEAAEALIGVRSALVEEVGEYLKDLKDQCARLPRYYPERFREDGSDQGNGFDRVRQMVQVVTDRSRLDEWLAQQREGLRREGLDPEGVFYGPNRGLPDGEGQAKPSKEVETLRWDHRAGRRFRRAILLGDPGFGKTWLLRYEARRLAQEGIDRLLVHQSHSLDQITLPIYIRLSDLAQTRGALDEALVDQVVGKRSTRFKSLVQDRLGSERCTILLDAWDEVPNREQLQPRIEKFAKDFDNPQILLTSRIVGYEQTPPPIRDAKELELLAMDWAQVLWKSACKRDPRRRRIGTHLCHTIHPYVTPSTGSWLR